MDLSKGIINGYDIMLKGTKSDNTGKTIIIDSSSDTTPLKIGKDFNVNWDGTLTCNKINSLNNDGNDNLAISINDNFYVTKGGGAGGSGCDFGGNFRGGFSGIGTGTFKGNFEGNFKGTGTGTFKGEGDFYTLKVGGKTFTDTHIWYIATLGLVRDGSSIKLNYFEKGINVLAHDPTTRPMLSASASLEHEHKTHSTDVANYVSGIRHKHTSTSVISSVDKYK